MAHVFRPLRQWQKMFQRRYGCTTLYHLLFPPVRPLAIRVWCQHLSFKTVMVTIPVQVPVLSFCRSVRFIARGLKLPDAPAPSDREDSDSDTDVKRSKNGRKREARRAVRWGMELASFSDPQIKRILRAASVEREVFEAIMLVKRLGPDVREGKRRQFNYIGKLLRKVQPELMDALIQASKDGDQSRLQALCGSVSWANGDEEEEEEETEHEEEEEGSDKFTEIASRWYDGLVNKDNDITKEVYSVHSVDFDRQELRKLVRNVHSVLEVSANNEDNEGEVERRLTRTQRSLARFLRSLAKQMTRE